MSQYLAFCPTCAGNLAYFLSPSTGLNNCMLKSQEIYITAIFFTICNSFRKVEQHQTVDSFIQKFIQQKSNNMITMIAYNYIVVIQKRSYTVQDGSNQGSRNPEKIVLSNVLNPPCPVRKSRHSLLLRSFTSVPRSNLTRDCTGPGSAADKSPEFHCSLASDTCRQSAENIVTK